MSIFFTNWRKQTTHTINQIDGCCEFSSDNEVETFPNGWKGKMSRDALCQCRKCVKQKTGH